MIQNPILRGFCPDPSIIRAGEDYYIATSTFEWWPGVRIFHSTDLKNWEQLPSPLRRKSQLDLVGNPPSGGVWAPCLSYDGKYFYLVYTDVKTRRGRYYNTHNYVVRTEDIRGEWSEPVYFNSVGFDPSLFHDTDGKKYLVNMVNGFKGILVQEVDPDTLSLIGEQRKVYGGSGLRCTEGPHMYHIGDWYYLIVAEGGTGYEHCVTMARSKSVWGPFETAPDNPILTSDRKDSAALQKCGHADIVETPEGEWYLVHLCSRPLGGQEWCTLGRETAIQKMRWDRDGWLRPADGGRTARLLVPEPGESAEAGGISGDQGGIGRDGVTVRGGVSECAGTVSCDKPAEYGADGFFHDDFDAAVLSVRYSSPRESYETFADVGARRGYLRLRGRESLSSLHHVSLLAVRQQSVRAVAEAAMEFAPKRPEHLAGLAYVYDAQHFYLLGKTLTEYGRTVLVLLKSDAGTVTDVTEPVEIPAEGEILLRAEVSEDGMSVQFWYAAAGEKAEFQKVGSAQTTQILTDEYCRGFTGAHFGLYAHDMYGMAACADFDYFAVTKDGDRNK